MLDAVFAIMILTVGFMIISSSKPKLSDELPLSTISENIFGIMSSVKINEICTGCACSSQVLSDYCSHGKIKNPDETLLDYIGEMHNASISDEEIKNFYLDIISNFVRDDLYHTDLIIDGHVVYPNTGKNTSLELISGKRLAFGYNEDTLAGTVKYWGPYIIEVNVWK